MPSKSAALEWLKSEVAHGRGEDKCHVIDVTAEAKERIKNEKKQTRFVLACDSPEAFSELHFEWDRIVKRVGNKSVAITLVTRAWREGLSDAAIDRLMAILDSPEFV
jgi:hypothetical protein